MTDQPIPPPPPPPGPPELQHGYAQQQQGYAQTGYPQAIGSSSKATPALILGIVGLICCGICAILAIIFGKQAKDEIAANPGMQGEGQAQAGFILGIVGTALWGAGILIYAIAAAASV